MKNRSTIVYIALALGITWLLWIPALLMVSSRGYPLPTIDYLLRNGSFQFINSEHVLGVVSFSLAVYGPLLAGLAASALEGGRQRVAEWIAPLLRWQVPGRWYGLVIAVALGIVLVPLLVGALLGLVTLGPGAVFPGLPLVLGMLVYQFLTSGLGEEPGWRGYLLPKWQASLGDEKAVWWAGLVWAVWHFPFTIYYTLQAAPDLPLGAQLSMLIPALIGQTMSLIGMTYIYAWLMKGTHSLFLAALLHALGNTFNTLGGTAVVVNPVISLAIAAMPWLVVVILEKTTRQPKVTAQSL